MRANMSDEVDLPVTAANVCKAGNAPRPQLPCGRHADTDCPWWQCCAWGQRTQDRSWGRPVGEGKS